MPECWFVANPTLCFKHPEKARANRACARPASRIISSSLKPSSRVISQDDSGASGPTMIDSGTIRPLATRTAAMATPPESPTLSTNRAGNERNLAQASLR